MSVPFYSNLEWYQVPGIEQVKTGGSNSEGIYVSNTNCQVFFRAFNTASFSQMAGEVHNISVSNNEILATGKKTSKPYKRVGSNWKPDGDVEIERICAGLNPLILKKDHMIFSRDVYGSFNTVLPFLAKSAASGNDGTLGVVGIDGTIFMKAPGFGWQEVYGKGEFLSIADKDKAIMINNGKIYQMITTTKSWEELKGSKHFVEGWIDADGKIFGISNEGKLYSWNKEYPAQQFTEEW